MDEFDRKAAEWDKSMMHRHRAEAVAEAIARQIPLNRTMSAMEFGAGTGLLSFNLKEQLGTITLIDNSEGMVKVLLEKTQENDRERMKVVKANLEKENYTDEKFDLIYTLMVLHHVDNVALILDKFRDMLKPGGFLAIADLHSEDGSFHGNGFTGHRGFDTNELAVLLEKHGFGEVSHRTVYTIEKPTADDHINKFGVFLMTALRKEK